MKPDHCGVYQNKSGKDSWNTTTDGVVYYSPRINRPRGISFHTYNWPYIQVYVQAKSLGADGTIRSCPVIGDDGSKFYFYGLACWPADKWGSHDEYRRCWYANNARQVFFDNTYGKGLESIQNLNKHRVPSAIQNNLNVLYLQKKNLLNS